MGIADNVNRILANIEEEKQRSRFKQDVGLTAVTKFRSADEISKLYQAGIRSFGENRVQEFSAKYTQMPDAHWHLIGSLQKNKIKYVLGKVSLIQSVDSVGLAAEINRLAKKQPDVCDILLQVNTAGEESKHGFSITELHEAIEQIAGFEQIRIKGLMMIAPDTPDIAYLEDIFLKTRNIFEEMMKYDIKYDNINMNILSMGMSNDYALAIRCGSTMVRIGRALFE